MKLQSFLFVFSFVGVMLCSCVVLADAIPNPPKDCPLGGRPDSNHVGQFCAIDTCSGTCSSGTCQATKLCIQEKKGASKGGPMSVFHVLGFCDANGQCQAGKCETHKVCRASSSPNESSIPDGVTVDKSAGSDGTSKGPDIIQVGPNCGCQGHPQGGWLFLCILAYLGILIGFKRRENP